jgi:hypothetical protein
VARGTPYILKLFWSPTQIAARTHPNALALLRELKSWWHDEIDPEKSFVEPYAYADALRIRPGGIPFPGLGPHIDAGSLCRWADPKYQDAYAKIWGGMPEQWDPYDLSVRKDANQAFFPGQTQSMVIRTFQGWTGFDAGRSWRGQLASLSGHQIFDRVCAPSAFFPPASEGRRHT